MNFVLILDNKYVSHLLLVLLKNTNKKLKKIFYNQIKNSIICQGLKSVKGPKSKIIVVIRTRCEEKNY